MRGQAWCSSVFLSLIPKVHLLYQLCLAPGSRMYRTLTTRQCQPTLRFRRVCLSADRLAARPRYTHATSAWQQTASDLGRGIQELSSRCPTQAAGAKSKLSAAVLFALPGNYISHSLCSGPDTTITNRSVLVCSSSGAS